MVGLSHCDTMPTCTDNEKLDFLRHNLEIDLPRQVRVKKGQSDMTCTSQVDTSDGAVESRLISLIDNIKLKLAMQQCR